MSGPKAGAWRTPASMTSVATPAWCNRSRTNWNSVPLVSSVPTRMTGIRERPPGCIGVGGCYNHPGGDCIYLAVAGRRRRDEHMIAVKAHFDGRFIVPDEPLDLRKGQKLVVRIEPAGRVRKS